MNPLHPLHLLQLDIPNVMIPLLLISWLGQVRLCRGWEGEEYRREKKVAQYGGLACLAAAAGVAVLNFFS